MIGALQALGACVLIGIAGWWDATRKGGRK